MGPIGIVAALLAGALPIAAQAEGPTLQDAIGNPADLKVSGSARVRYETLDGQPRTGLRDKDEQLALPSTLFAESTTRNRPDWGGALRQPRVA